MGPSTRILTFLEYISYNIGMRNWSTNIKKLSKYPEKYAIWKLEQLINFGLGKTRLNRIELKKYLPKLDIDPLKRRYLEYILG